MRCNALYVCCFLLLYGCAGVEKHNKFINSDLTINKQLKDIDYLQKKMKNVQPNLYAYTSKEKLDEKFDSVRKTITKPLKPNEFYFKVAPLLTAVKQGHNNVLPLQKKYSKEENKKLKKMGLGPMSQFDFKWINSKLYVSKNKSKDTLLKRGLEVVSIEGLKPQDVYDKYSAVMTSDGYNKTWLPFLFSRRISSFVFNEIGLKDSLVYEFKMGDSLIKKTIRRLKKEEKKEFTKKDTIAKDSIKEKKIITTTEKKAAKKKRKLKRDFKYNYGYDYLTKEYSKVLTFTDVDSTTAIFKIKNFSKGGYKDTYKEVFTLLQKKETKNLILDLRNNPGGRLDEIHNLYSYLTQDASYQLIENARVTSKISILKANFFKGMPKFLYVFAVPTYPIYAGISFFRTKKDDKGYYFRMKSSKIKPQNPAFFKGKIYVLINGGSFSASCIIASKLKQNPDITFVGEETGGDFNGTVAGRVAMQKLPKSKLDVQLWIMEIAATNKTKTIGRGIFSDVAIVPTLQDFIEEKDPELDWIKKDIALKK